jgi:hypothetical protein
MQRQNTLEDTALFEAAYPQSSIIKLGERENLTLISCWMRCVLEPTHKDS